MWPRINRKHITVWKGHKSVKWIPVQSNIDESISPVQQLARLLYEHVIEDANRNPSPVREFASEHYEERWWDTASDEEIEKQLKLQQLIDDFWAEDCER